MSRTRKIAKRTLLVLLSVAIVLILFTYSITQLEDQLSAAMRSSTQKGINNYIAKLSENTANNSLTIVDKSIIHAGALLGISISYFSYPEASELLFHYIYGKGERLELSPSYFKKSKYLHGVIKLLGNGQHGPLSLKQKEDWRLSLTFNPYFLIVSSQTVRIYHPKIEFAPSNNKNVFTVVPIGKLKLKVYDNIVSALKPTPLYAYAEWSNYPE